MVASFMINTIFISVLAHMLLILWHGIQYRWFCISSFFRSNTFVANWLCLLLEIYWFFAGQLPPGSSLPSIGGMFPNILPFGVAGQVIPFSIFFNMNLYSFLYDFFAWTGLFCCFVTTCIFAWISSTPLSSSHKQWLNRYGSLVNNVRRYQ
jgi:hypothetical protein